MSLITYTALREFEPSAVASILGSDISVDTADDSFNGVTSDLAGLLEDEWILVSGFTNEENNGWFQLASDSTTGKILVLGVNLVTEAAGSNVTIKGYKRGLGESYTLPFGLEQADRSVNVTRHRSKPLGGGPPETLLHRREVFYNLRTGIIEETELAQWREFMASVEGGETFILDRYGSEAVPVEPLNFIMDSDSYSEEREILFRYHISFRVQQVL
jgi:hypothetical protein